MDRELAAEQLCDDVAEFVAHYSESDPVLERIAELQGSQRGREFIRSCGRASDGEVVRLAPDTRARIRRLRPRRRSRTVNAALGAAIFATVSGAALVVLESPYSYIFAAGSAALAAITLAREFWNRA